MRFSESARDLWDIPYARKPGIVVILAGRTQRRRRGHVCCSGCINNILTETASGPGAVLALARHSGRRVTRYRDWKIATSHKTFPRIARSALRAGRRHVRPMKIAPRARRKSASNKKTRRLRANVIYACVTPVPVTPHFRHRYPLTFSSGIDFLSSASLDPRRTAWCAMRCEVSARRSREERREGAK